MDCTQILCVVKDTEGGDLPSVDLELCSTASYREPLSKALKRIRSISIATTDKIKAWVSSGIAANYEMR